MKKIIVFILISASLASAQFPSFKYRPTTTQIINENPDYVYQANFIANVGYDTTLWADIGLDIYGSNPSGQFTSAPLLIPAFFDTVSFVQAVTSTYVAIYSGRVNMRWDAVIWDVDDKTVEYNEDAIALFSRMTTQPNTARKQLISDFIDSLQLNGTKNFWTNADRIWDMAAHDSTEALLNWKADTDTLLPINGITFVADQGFSGNGTNQYINTYFVPSTDGVNLTQNSTFFALYSRTNLIEAKAEFGGRGVADGNRGIIVRIRHTGNQIWVRLNDGSDLPLMTNTDSRGLFGGSRLDANINYTFANYADSTVSNVSIGMTTCPLFLCTFNNSGVPSTFYSTKQFAFLYLGGKLTTTEKDVFIRIVEWYMDEKGTGVMP
jgi:hypothetical protein